jgi:8-oxo-dGTP diphosphatase
MEQKSPRHFYRKQARFHQAVDCVIFGFERDELKLLVIRRRFQPARGQWSLMGGFLHRDENLEEGARRVLEELTGLYNVYLEQLHTYSRVHRDPGERVISTAYYALIGIQDSDLQRTHAHNAHWVNIGNMPPLIFDHGAMVEAALDELRRKCRYFPVGFELLPAKFTMTRLQKLYEAIFGQRFDSANFRRKMISTGLLQRLEEKERSTSKRGAHYYRFDQEAYERLRSRGFLPDLPWRNESHTRL